MRRFGLSVLCLISALSLGAQQVPHIEVATWNLEWFNHGQRGFPENTHGGPSYGPRDELGFRTIAYLIQKHDLEVVGLQEISGEEDLAQLLAYLPGYRMSVVSESATQHCALLWDAQAAQVEIQPPLASLAVSSGQRQGLHAWIRSGEFIFDYLVVHLANKDEQVARQVGMIQSWLRGTLPESPVRDDDVIIGGDLNLTPRESPLQALIADALLAWCFAEVTELPPTRAPSHKTIDHLFFTRQCYADLRLGETYVPREDQAMGAQYRALVSDHLPVIQSLRTDRD